jgi:fructan beta-fructosidase
MIPTRNWFKKFHTLSPECTRFIIFPFFLSNKRPQPMKTNVSRVLTFTALIAVALTSCNLNRSDIVIADFESDSYGEWTIQGEAFGNGPSQGSTSEKIKTKGFQGEKLAISHNEGGASTGKLISPAFTLERKYINFLLGGENAPGETCINLLVDGQVVLSAPDPVDINRHSSELTWISWDVTPWKRKEAVIEIVDQHGGERGVVSVDQIYQSDENQVYASFEYDAKRTLNIDKPYLNVPIDEGADPKLLSIYKDGEMIRQFQLTLADTMPDYWMFLDMSEWQGENIDIQISKIATESEGFKSIFLDETVKGFENLYKEKDRPQFHFTSRRGWHNDANGLLYYEGEYHLFYQHNPLGWPWGNMTWGHAISEDLIHWEEIAPAIYPDHQGTEFSGSGVVDWNNTTGFRKGEEKPLVLMYTAAGGTSKWSEDEPFTQGIAYSNDKGRTWTKYSGNPVLNHIVDANRDPKVVWHEPSGHWITALFLTGNDFGLFRSKDMKSWEQIQTITIAESGECPDFFEIPLDGDPNNTKWVITGANGRFMVGEFDGKKFTPETESYPSEFGMNYYAVQSFSDVQDGRRIQVGWMAGSNFTGMPFNQQFAIPRELTLRTTPQGIRLFGNPAREISSLHGEKEELSDVTLTPEETPESQLQGGLYHIIADISTRQSSATEFSFNLQGFALTYNIKEKMLRAHRPSDDQKREVKLLPRNGKIKLEILVDRGSIEVYGNEGEVPMSFFYLAPDGNNTLSLQSNGGDTRINSIEVYEMNPIW